MISVIIVEDTQIIQDGLVQMINDSEEFVCLGAYNNCEAMLSDVEILKPKVIIMDLGLPGMNGIEGTKAVKKISPDTNIVVFTVNEESTNVFEALISGACGYLTKTTPPEELLTAIKNAADGGSPMNCDIAKKMVILLREMDSSKKEEQQVLSDRENEVLSALALGQGYKQIAETLFISIHTVRYHIRNIYNKLNVHTQSEAISIAAKKGLI